MAPKANAGGPGKPSHEGEAWRGFRLSAKKDCPVFAGRFFL